MRITYSTYTGQGECPHPHYKTLFKFWKFQIVKQIPTPRLRINVGDFQPTFIFIKGE